MRKPYQTTTRARGLLYVKRCIAAGKLPSCTEMVRYGIGADRKSARRVREWAIKQLEFAPLCSAQ